MVTLARRVHRIPFAPVVALLFGIVSAILVAAVPQWMFEAAIVASGLPTVLAAASPPLGLLARLLAIVLAFGAGAVAVWALVAPLAGYFEAKARARTPWRDAGYDIETASVSSDLAPPRRPIFAPDELGAPLMSDEAIAPAPPYPGVAPALAAPITVEEVPLAVASPLDTDDSIAGLIRRLENGLARRASHDRDPDGSGMGALPHIDERTSPQTVAELPPEATDDTVLGQTSSSFRRLAAR